MALFADAIGDFLRQRPVVSATMKLCPQAVVLMID